MATFRHFKRGQFQVHFELEDQKGRGDALVADGLEGDGWLVALHRQLHLVDVHALNLLHAQQDLTGSASYIRVNFPTSNSSQRSGPHLQKSEFENGAKCPKLGKTVLGMCPHFAIMPPSSVGESRLLT